ncbi:MAG: YdcF family protein [Syntrophaceae bacterium]|nr:YdcF family protein [Syntrophaceae bacterium]
MMTPFLLKKIISRLFFPIPLILELLVLGIFLKKWRKRLLIAAAVLLFLFSSFPFSYLFLKPLEGRYSPLGEEQLDRAASWIVVLGAGARDHGLLTPEDRLEDATLKRLLEGVRLSRLLPEAKLVLAGGNYKGWTSEAVQMKQVALASGLPEERILLEPDSWDTDDQARLLKGRLGQSPFYLVTSACHMPRAMRLFKRADTRPFAAPTDFLAVKAGSWDIMDFIPSGSALLKTEKAFYEYLGLGWTLVTSVFLSRT